jgi:hypothetical protein
MIEGGTHLHPVPWVAVQVKRNEQGELTPVIDTSKYQLYPEITLKDAKDLSPSVQQLVQDMQILREREPRKAPGREGLGVTKQPASAGPMGEDQAGGGGPSGTRALPPGKAPGFEEEQKNAINPPRHAVVEDRPRLLSAGSFKNWHGPMVIGTYLFACPDSQLFLAYVGR